MRGREKGHRWNLMKEITGYKRPDHCRCLFYNNSCLHMLEAGMGQARCLLITVLNRKEAQKGS